MLTREIPFWYFNLDYPDAGVSPILSDSEEVVRDKAERCPWLIIFESSIIEINKAAFEWEILNPIKFKKEKS